MSGGKAIANRQYRRRVNAGDFDEYPQHARAAYRRTGIDSYDVVDGVLRQPWSSVQAEIEEMRQAVERNDGEFVKVVPEQWCCYFSLQVDEHGKPEFERHQKLVPAHQVWLIPERFTAFDDWVQFRFQEWRRCYYWK